MSLCLSSPRLSLARSLLLSVFQDAPAHTPQGQPKAWLPQVPWERSPRHSEGRLTGGAASQQGTHPGLSHHMDTVMPTGVDRRIGRDKRPALSSLWAGGVYPRSTRDSRGSHLPFRQQGCGTLGTLVFPVGRVAAGPGRGAEPCRAALHLAPRQLRHLCPTGILLFKLENQNLLEMRKSKLQELHYLLPNSTRQGWGWPSSQPSKGCRGWPASRGFLLGQQGAWPSSWGLRG